LTKIGSISNTINFFMQWQLISHWQENDPNSSVMNSLNMFIKFMLNICVEVRQICRNLWHRELVIIFQSFQPKCRLSLPVSAYWDYKMV
jgi:hypothetical protein